MDGHSSVVTRPPGVPPKVAGFRFWLLALVVLPTLANNYTFELLSIIVTPIKDHYHISNSDFGLLYSFYELPNMIIPLAGGVFLARIGATKGSCIIALICAFGTLLVALSVPTGNFNMLLIGRTLYGIGAETLTIAIEVLVTVYFENHELSLAYGVLIAVSRAGDTLPCVSPHIQDWLFGADSQWSSSSPMGFALLLWLCVALFASGLIALAILFYLEGNDICTDVDAADDEEIAAVEPDDTSLRAAFSHLKPQFWLFVIMGALATGAYSPFIIYTPDYLHVERGLPMHDSAQYVMELYFGSMILSPFLGSLIDKIGQRPLLAFGSLIAMAAAYAAVIWLPVSLFSSFGFYSLAAAVFYSTLYPMLPLTATSTAYYSHNFAISTCVSNLVLFVSYWGVGRVSEVVSYESAYYLYIAMTLLASVLALVLWQVDLRSDRQLSMTSHELAEDSMSNTKDENALADEMRRDIGKKHNVPIGLVHPWERISNRIGTNVYDDADWEGPITARDWWQPADGPRTMPIRRRPQTPVDEDIVSSHGGANGDNPKTPLLRPKTPIRGAAVQVAVANATTGMTAAEAAEALKGVGLLNLDFMRTMSDPTTRYGALLQGAPNQSPPQPDRQRSAPDDATTTTETKQAKQLQFADDDTLRSPASGAIIASAPPGVDAAQLREWQLGRAPETAYGYHSMEMDEDHRHVNDPVKRSTSLGTSLTRTAAISSLSSSSSISNPATISGRPP